MNDQEFTDLIRRKATELYREMPWRDEPTFYNVLVSEIMLQQTQVARALTKFDEFMTRFESIEELAQASLADVLQVWQGLGYNRRAKYLHEAAKSIVSKGIPNTKALCIELPGVGENTAGAIMAYVYSQPAIFIETNIRTVYLHHFFADQDAVSDARLRERVASTLDQQYPREFYWALMDYGSWLKANGVRNGAASKHYVKQSPLKGSVREMRGQIIRSLTLGPVRDRVLFNQLGSDGRFDAARDGLIAEGLIEVSGKHLQLTK